MNRSIYTDEYVSGDSTRCQMFFLFLFMFLSSSLNMVNGFLVAFVFTADSIRILSSVVCKWSLG